MLSASHQAPHVDPQHVLLVDDHDDTRELYSLYLTSVGYDVEDAATFTDATRRIAQRTPDVIITDLRMPDGDGFQFCRTLKESAMTQDVPLIAVTAAADARTAWRAREAGCVAVMTKPCLPAELGLKIAHVLEASLAARRSAAFAVQHAEAVTEKVGTVKARSEQLLEVARQRLRTLTHLRRRSLTGVPKS